jgi:hypothetical protein
MPSILLATFTVANLIGFLSLMTPWLFNGWEVIVRPIHNALIGG